jgi:GxxExxY protein
MNTDERRFDTLTERVLGAVFEVSNTLGAGFLEKIYERALVKELTLRGIKVVPKRHSQLSTKATPSENISPTY